MPSFSECTLSVMCYAKGTVAEAAENVLDAVVSAVATGLEWSLRTMGEVIMSGNTITDSEGSAITWLQGQTIFLTMTLTIISVFVAAGQMIWTRRGQPLKDLAASLVKLVVISAASVSGILLLVEAGDSWATWIMSSVDSEDWITDKMLDSFLGMTPMGPIIMMILGLIGIIAGVIQWALQFIRIPLLILLAGVWPLAAAATNTEWGKSWFQKMTGWIAAFLLFKPAVGIILALGARLMFSTDDASIWRPMLEGLLLIIMSCFAVPALVKFIVPAGAAMGSSGGSAGAAIASGAAVVATGSIRASGGGGDGASGSSAGGSGSTASSAGAASAGAKGASDSGSTSTGGPSGGESGDGSGSRGGKHSARASGADDSNGGSSSFTSSSQGSGGASASSGAGEAASAGGAASGGAASSGAGAAAGGAGAVAGPAGMAAVKAGQAAAGAVKNEAEESTAEGSE